MNRSPEKQLFLTCFVMALFFFDPRPEVSFGRHLLPAKALWETAHLYVDDVMRKSTADVIFSNGHYYSAALPGPTIVMYFVYPFYKILSAHSPHVLTLIDPNSYWLLSLLGVLFFMAPCLALSSVIAMRLFSRFMPPSHSAWLSSALCLGTPFLFYGQRVTEYPPLLLLELLFLVVFFDTGGKEARKNKLLGLSASAMLLFNPIGAVVSALFLLFSEKTKVIKRLPGLIAGALPPLALFLAFQKATFGSFLGSGYNPNLNSQSILHVYTSYLLSGRWGALAKQMIHEVPVATWHTLVGIRGLWTFLPISIPASLALFATGKTKAGAALSGTRAAFLFNFLVVVSFIHGIWTGGPSWGPRYLLPGIPFLLLAIPLSKPNLSLESLRGWSLLSLLVTWLGVQAGYCSSPLEALFYFLLSGPTTPLHRWFWYHADKVLIPDLLARSSPGPFAQYVSYHNISACGAYLLLAAVLALIWFRNPSPKRE